MIYEWQLGMYLCIEERYRFKNTTYFVSFLSPYIIQITKSLHVLQNIYQLYLQNNILS